MPKLTEVLKRLEQSLQQHHRVIDELFREGVRQPELRQKIRTLPYRLPREVIQLYQWHDGTRPDYPVAFPFFPRGNFLSLDEALHQYTQSMDIAREVAAATGGEPSETWDPHWFPLFSSFGGDDYVVRCEEKMRATSPVYFIVNDDRSISVAYDSVICMLATIAACYESGACSVEQDGTISEDAKRVAEITRAHNPKRTKWALDQGEGAPTLAGLVRTLKHPDGGVAGNAAGALMDLRDPRAVRPLLEALKTPGGHALTVRILGEIGDRRAVAPLIHILNDWEAQAPRVAAAAATALGEIGDPRAAAPLIRAVRHNGEPNTRAMAAVALGKLQAVQAVEPLIWAIQQDGDNSVRAAAARALGVLGDFRAVSILLQALGEGSALLRRSATEALGQLKASQAVEALIQALDDSVFNVRIGAVYALEQIGDPRAIDPITQLANDSDYTMRHVVQRALTKLQKADT